MVIYPYPVFGVIFMVILSIFNRKYNPNFSQIIITLNSYLGSFTPFYDLREVTYKFTFP